MKLSGINLINYNSIKYKNKKSLDHFNDDRKHEIALEISNVGLWEWDIKKNKTYYSEEFKNIINFSGNELKSTPQAWRERVHPDDFEDYTSRINAHLVGEAELYEHEYRVLCKDGSYKWILAKGKVIEKNTSNEPTKAIGTIIDITNIRKRKDLITKTLQVMSSENKRLQNFTHIVSHNLKTHIGNFKNILEFYDDANNESEKEELIGHLKSISESLTTTIVDLDDIISIKSKANLNQFNEHINLHHCVNKITESLTLDSTKNEVTIHNALRQDETLFSNRSYLESVFYNIISNGIKYADPNKKSQIIIQSIHTKDTIKIMISDNGIGIDTTKFKDQLFDMYQTFHGTDRKDSRGIGLYITKTQVEALDGEIELESKLNEGTAFILTFKKHKTLVAD
ncbi:sensor histidine kinase [Winogradskyella psychrotolerans]|uniref:sensor histidine kinase n=1 Tax=Winogradskyella psychrotolerans TaxID=1344585 RepID=UPI001C07C039|nr:PAS domain-containing sensor histidine kinase [Winogradskyella psychrotolerans]MBU2927243.1 PAS domain-containing sensor histidine kinase [Winogradskyella psychrotolerans]